MRKTQDGLEMTAADLAASAFRAFHQALGRPADIEDADGDAQSRWLGACRWASLNLPSYDGKPVSVAVNAFVDQWTGEDVTLRPEALGGVGLVPWEAAVRHLCALLDSDDLEGEEDVLALEASWAAWAQKRRPGGAS